jgi:predicted permease
MALILLIACTNVAALMLGQVEGRSTELAVRAALGATRGRITQQLVVEALVLGVAAGLVGAALAAGGFRLLAGALPIGAWSDNVSVDWSVVVAALAIAVLAVLFVVLVPATSLWRGNLRDGLNRARTGGVHGRGGRLEHGLVVAEVGVAMLIATGTALLVRSVANRYAIDPGIDAKDVAVVDFIVPSNVTPRDRRRTTNELLASLSSLPGVRSTASAMKLPLRGGGDSFGITIQGHENAEQSFTYFRIVTPDYFSTMDIKVVAGRGFAASDRPDSTEVPVVINQALVKKYFPGENPLGRIMGDGFGVRQRVIGIVGDVAEAELQKEAEPTRYYSANTVGMFGARQSVVLRVTRGSDPATILDLARRTAQRVAPSFALQGTTTMQRVLDTAVGPVRQIMSLLALLAALALVLGAVGIYGVISHFAARRQRDWAIRVALGLPGSSVVKHIVGQGAGLVALGIALGAIGTLALARLLTSFLFGVSAVDPISFAAASGAMLLVGLGAAFIPARRAGTVDPALVLREQ